MMIRIVDCCVIGAGPAGATACIYLKRLGVDFRVYDSAVGGVLLKTDVIENYTGFDVVKGNELAMKITQQFKRLMIFKHMINTTVVGVARSDDHFAVVDSRGVTSLFKTIIIACGCMNRWLNVDGERRLKGFGVSYCAICDGFLYKRLTVCVVGGANSALTDALFLSKICERVYVVNKNNHFKGDKILFRQVESERNVEMIYNALTTKIIGEKTVEAIQFERFNNLETLPVDAVFVKIGVVSNLLNISFSDCAAVGNRFGYVSVDCKTMTKQRGIFACGDVVNGSFQQIAIAVGQGASCALNVVEFLR